MTDLSSPLEELGRLDEVFVFIAKQDGVEGVPMTKQRGPDGSIMVLPMVCTEVSQIPEYRKVAERMSETMGIAVELVRFSGRESIDWIGDPEAGDAPKATPSAECGNCGQRIFGTLIETGLCGACAKKEGK